MSDQRPIPPPPSPKDCQVILWEGSEAPPQRYVLETTEISKPTTRSKPFIQIGAFKWPTK